MVLGLNFYRQVCARCHVHGRLPQGDRGTSREPASGGSCTTRKLSVNAAKEEGTAVA